MKNTNNYLIQRLMEQYKTQKCVEVADCIKLTYQYNKVKVALYFDNYDEISCNLSLILSYGDDVYCNKLNVYDLEKKDIYLSSIPDEILIRIKKENHLADFYGVMRNKIQNGQIEKANYNDPTFTRAVKKCQINKEPFFWYLKKVNMTDNHLNFLHKHLNISYKILSAIKNQGYTIATTKDVTNRKKLTFELEYYKIKF